MSNSEQAPVNQAWKEFTNKLMFYSQDAVIRLSREDSFTFEFEAPDGTKIAKTYTRRKVSNREWQELEELLADTDDMKARKKPTEATAEEKKAFAAQVAKLYQKRAEYLLRMTKDDYYILPFRETKDVIDTLVWENVNGRPL